MAEGEEELKSLLMKVKEESENVGLKLNILQPGFNNTWTMNFEMFKLGIEKAEEPEMKLSTSVGSWKK